MDSKELAKTLSLVNYVSPSVHVSNNGQAVWSSTDMTTWLVMRTESIGDEFDAVLYSREWLNVARNSGGDISSKGLNHSGTAIVFDTGAGEIELALRNPQGDAMVPKFLPDSTSRVSTKKLIEIFEKLSHAMSRDGSRFNLNNICVDGPNNLLVTTDGHRLSKIEADWLPGRQTLLPASCIPKILKTLKAIKKSVPEILVVWSEKYVRFQSDNVEVICELKNEKFPDYNKVIPQDAGDVVFVNRDELRKAIRLVKIMTSDRNKGIDLIFSDDGLTLTSVHPDLGTAKTTIDCRYTGEKPRDLLINCKYLDEAIKSTGDMVRLSTHGEGSPIMLNDELVMPMRR